MSGFWGYTPCASTYDMSGLFLLCQISFGGSLRSLCHMTSNLATHFSFKHRIHFFGLAPHEFLGIILSQRLVNSRHI